jgi:dihydroorotate dehydrogenase
LDIYQSLVRPLVFSGLKLDPEQLHFRLLQSLEWLGEDPLSPMVPGLQSQLKTGFRTGLRRSLTLQHPSLSQTLWGVRFENPIGLAAGFDKDGVGAPLWGDFGFGFAELGTVTQHPQPGNPQPRLFRLVEDQAVLNRMGFNNGGSQALADRLQRLVDQGLLPRPEFQLEPQSEPTPSIPLGINLGKSKITPLEKALDDYCHSFRLLEPWGHYFVVNVSSPNTPGLRSLQSSENLGPILGALQQINQGVKGPDGARSPRPLLLKIAPDLAWEDIDAILELAQTHRLAGLIATNTTIDRSGLQSQTLAATGRSLTEEAGGISGAPLRDRSTEIIRYIYRHTEGKLPIVGVGGVFSAEDAWAKITAGASLVQLYTGWVYQGPWMVKRILMGLQQRLGEHQLEHLQEAVGLDHR